MGGGGVGGSSARCCGEGEWAGLNRQRREGMGLGRRAYVFAGAEVGNEEGSLGGLGLSGE